MAGVALAWVAASGALAPHAVAQAPSPAGAPSAAAAAAPPPVVRIPDRTVSETPAPPPPDYSRDSAWAALPGRLDAADVVPENDAFGDRQASAPVDVFYIHPTTFRSADAWNQPLDDARTNDWTDESVIARQAAVFNACCRVYAPRYRQAAAAAVYAPPAKQPQLAYELAWGDVRNAFRHYLKHWNRGRPFIIAGHSQGAAHAQRWLAEFGADPQLRRRLVAVYAIGIGFTDGTLQHLGPQGIAVCATPTASGCLVSWNTFARGSDGAAGWRASTRQRAAAAANAAAGSGDGAGIACVNPLSFDLARPDVPASGNMGALPARPGIGLATALREGRALPALEAGRLGASCDDGALWVDAPPAQGYAIVPLPGGMLHFNDYDLFYANLRINAVVRSEAFVAGARTRR